MKTFVLAAAAVAALAGSSLAQPFVQGTWNGYAFDTPMTFMGGVKWSHTLTMTPGSRHNGLAATAGYATQAPPAFADARWEVPASGQVTVNFFDQDSWSDGWLPTNQRRFGLEGLTNSWEVMGSWNGFSAGTLLTPVGGGVYEATLNLAPGNYEWKFRYAGDWDINIGVNTLGNNQGNASVDSPINGNSNITFRLDLPNGRIQAIPTPGALALLGLGGLMATRRRR